MKKSAFTLIEILVSLAIFSIVLVFLNQTLDSAKKHNQKYEKAIESKLEKFDLEYIVFQDIVMVVPENNISLNISEDKEKNSIIALKTTNTYHNPFYNDVTYMLSKEKELLRIESNIKFDKEKLNDFIEKSYIDVLTKGLEKFVITLDKENKNHILYLEFDDKTSLFFPIKK